MSLEEAEKRVKIVLSVDDNVLFLLFCFSVFQRRKHTLDVLKLQGILELILSIMWVSNCRAKFRFSVIKTSQAICILVFCSN